MGKYFDRHFTRKLCQWQLCHGNMLTIINYKRNKRLQLDAITHSLCFPDGSAGKESACSAGDNRILKFDLFVGKISWSRKWQPTLLYPWDFSCLKSPMDRGARWATIQRVAESQK